GTRTAICRTARCFRASYGCARACGSCSEIRTRPALLILHSDPFDRRVHEVVVATPHSLSSQGTSVDDLLLADSSPTRVFGRIVLVGRPALEHSARTEARLEVGKVLGVRVIPVLGFFLGIQVVADAR